MSELPPDQPKELVSVSLFFVLMCAVCILFLLFPRASRACTSVVAGRNASSTGRVIVGHNEDDPGRLIVRHALVPSRRWDDGDVITAEERSARIPQPPRTLAFFWTQVRGERGLSNADGFYNERGVLVVSDSCLSSRLDDEPDLVAGGIGYALRRAVAERASSARSGVEIAAQLVDRYGYRSPGRGYVIADSKEAWIVQFAGGKDYCGVRVLDVSRVVAGPTCCFWLASLGAGVMHSRAVEFGKKFDIPIHVRSSLNDSKGTMITKEAASMEGIVVRGAALTRELAKVTIRAVPDTPGVAAKIFHEIAAANIVVDDIIQNIYERGGLANIGFTTTLGDLDEAKGICEKLAREIGIRSVEVDSNVAKVSIVGIGMKAHTGVASRMFKALADGQVNIQNISTSEIVISCIVDQNDGEKALRLLHNAFELDRG